MKYIVGQGHTKKYEHDAIAWNEWMNTNLSYISIENKYNTCIYYNTEVDHNH